MQCAFKTISIIVLTTVFVNGIIGLKNNLNINWGNKQSPKYGISDNKWHKTTSNFLKHGFSLNFLRENNETTPITLEEDALDSNETKHEETFQNMIFDWIQETVDIMGAAHNDPILDQHEFNFDLSGEITTRRTTLQTYNFDAIDDMVDNLQSTAAMGNETEDENNTLTYKEAMQQYQEGKITTGKADPEEMKEALQNWMKDMSDALKMVKNMSRSRPAEDHRALLRKTFKNNSNTDMSVHKRLERLLSGLNPTLKYDLKRIKPTHQTILRQGTEATVKPTQESTLHTIDIEGHLGEDVIFDYDGQGGAIGLFDTADQGDEYGPVFTPDLKSVANVITTLASTEPTSTIHPVIAAANKHREENKVGYFRAFVSQLFLMIAKKDDDHVQELARATELVLTEYRCAYCPTYKRPGNIECKSNVSSQIETLTSKNNFSLYKNPFKVNDTSQPLERWGSLNQLGRPFLPAISQGMRLVSASPGDVIKGQALMAHDMLLHENASVSNDIIDITRMIDTMYLDTEGEALFESLILVDEYPKNNLTNVQVMTKVIGDSVLTPYRRLSGSDQLKKLIYKINEAIKLRYPLIPYRKYYNNFNRRKGRIQNLEYGEKIKTDKRDKVDLKALLVPGTAQKYLSEKYPNKLKRKSPHKHLKRDREQMKFQKVFEHLRNNHPKIYKKYVKHHRHRRKKNKRSRHKQKHNLERTDHNYEKLLRDRNRYTEINDDETKDSESTDYKTTEEPIGNINSDFKKRFTVVKTTAGERNLKKNKIKNIKLNTMTDNDDSSRTTSIFNQMINKWNITPKRNIINKKESKHSYTPKKFKRMPIKIIAKTKKKKFVPNVTDSSSQSDKENLNLFDLRRFNTIKRKNKITEDTSYSDDEEVILKSNIYKAFGYNRDVIEESE